MYAQGASFALPYSCCALTPFSSQVKTEIIRRWGAQIVSKLRILLYADDVMCALANEELVAFCRVVQDSAAVCERDLRTLGLSPEPDKVTFMINDI